MDVHASLSLQHPLQCGTRPAQSADSKSHAASGTRQRLELRILDRRKQLDRGSSEPHSVDLE
eukprot:13395270-Alexandrium_andersonii.AAC.1